MVGTNPTYAGRSEVTGECLCSSTLKDVSPLRLLGVIYTNPQPPPPLSPPPSLRTGTFIYPDGTRTPSRLLRIETRCWTLSCARYHVKTTRTQRTFLSSPVPRACVRSYVAGHPTVAARPRSVLVGERQRSGGPWIQPSPFMPCGRMLPPGVKSRRVERRGIMMHGYTGSFWPYRHFCEQQSLSEISSTGAVKGGYGGGPDFKAAWLRCKIVRL